MSGSGSSHERDLALRTLPTPSGGDSITFAGGMTGGNTITLTSHPSRSRRTPTITGQGTGSTLISGNHAVEDFYINVGE